MSYQPKLFIGIGATAAFFTLRQTYQHFVPGPGDYGNSVLNGVYQGTIEIRSFHHYNLSQDINEAIEKATKAADEMALPLVPASADMLAEQMREITRASAEVIAERQRASAAAQAAWEAQRAEWDAARIIQQADLLKAGRFPFGKYVGELFNDVEIGYVNWIMDKRDEFEPVSHMRALADAVWLHCAALKLPTPDPAATIGEPGKRIELEVRAIRQISFATDFGQKYVTTMVTPEGACVVVLSTSWALDVGECAKIKATVKEHSEFRGQMQTVVQRVKNIEEKAA
jgi:uncharacterized protein (DUF3820 family)